MGFADRSRVATKNAVWLMPCRWLHVEYCTEVLSVDLYVQGHGDVLYMDKDMDSSMSRAVLRNIRKRPHIPVKTSFHHLRSVTFIAPILVAIKAHIKIRWHQLGYHQPTQKRGR